MQNETTVNDTLMYNALKRQGSKEMIQLLLDHGANVNSTPAVSDKTPLQLAIYFNPDGIPLLIKHGANLNTKNKTGRTPLDHIVTLKKFKSYKH